MRMTDAPCASASSWLSHHITHIGKDMVGNPIQQDFTVILATNFQDKLITGSEGFVQHVGSKLFCVQ